MASAFCQKPASASICQVSLRADDAMPSLSVVWEDGSCTTFPASWLRVMGPVVAEKEGNNDVGHTGNQGWLVSDLKVPEFSYEALVQIEGNENLHLRLYDAILQPSVAGLIKITNLPDPDINAERNKENTLVTRVLKQLFGSVFIHPRRGADKTFNVASHHEDGRKRAERLPNYDTNQVLLPHVDHAHYIQPIWVQGWYQLEGESENTFVSSFAVLDTMKKECPELVQHLYDAPMAMGRVAYYYDPHMFQGTTDTAITTLTGFSHDRNAVKAIRWHPHLTGSLLSPFEHFHEARLAFQKFQEIMRRDTHQWKVLLKPGDLFVWDNFRILHGRERVLEVPRTGVGQTVPEQVVADRYRAILVEALRKHMDEQWLVHMPLSQLRELYDLVVAL